MRIKSIRNIRIKTKLLLLGGISILGLLFIGAESIITAKKINEASTQISQSWVPAIIIAEELNTETSDYRIKEFYHVITRDPQTLSQLEAEMMAVRNEINEAFSKYDQYYVANEADRSLMEKARSYWNNYLEYSDKLLTVSRSDDTGETLTMIIGKSKELFDKSSSMFLKMADFNRMGAESASIHANQLYTSLAREKLLSVCIIALIIALLVIYVIIAIDKPVKAIVEGTRKVSNGDLDVYLPYHSQDEIGILTDSVNQLIERLKSIIDDEKYLFQEIGNENFTVKSSCEQAYRGDFAPILYSLSSLMSRLDLAKQRKEELKRMLEEKVLEIRRMEPVQEEETEVLRETGGAQSRLLHDAEIKIQKAYDVKVERAKESRLPSTGKDDEEADQDGGRTMDATNEEGRLL